MCPRLSANYVSCCPPNMAQVSVWAGNLHLFAKTLNKVPETPVNRAFFHTLDMTQAAVSGIM